LPATIRPNSNSLISALSGETRWAEDTMGLAALLEAEFLLGMGTRFLSNGEKV
jgi:hypothetical protein